MAGQISVYFYMQSSLYRYSGYLYIPKGILLLLISVTHWLITYHSCWLWQSTYPWKWRFKFPCDDIWWDSNLHMQRRVSVYISIWFTETARVFEQWSVVRCNPSMRSRYETPMSASWGYCTEFHDVSF